MAGEKRGSGGVCREERNGGEGCGGEIGKNAG